MEQIICCCGTGHRPNKLYQGYNGESFILKAIEQSKCLDNIQYGISGMALGFDTALAIMFTKYNIPWIAAVPFKGQESIWPISSRKKYIDLLSKAVKVVYVDELNNHQDKTIPVKMMERNEWMVDNSNMVIALWNGTSGGTKNCITYANKQVKQIINIWDVYSQEIEKYKIH